jgi:hypothetical protein
MSASNLFLGGTPTKLDVDKLRDKFGVPKEGDVITFDDLESVLSVSRRTFRFKTVLNAWRKALDREHNVVFGPDRGKGLICLPPNERIELSLHKSRIGVRMVGRAGRIASCTDRARLTPENQRAADHMERSVAAIKLALATSAKAVKLPSLEK